MSRRSSGESLGSSRPSRCPATRSQRTRAIIDAINGNQLDGVETVEDPIFGFAIPTSCPNVAESLLQPKKTWADPQAYDQKAKELAHLFRKNFTAYESGVSDAVKAAAPKV